MGVFKTFGINNKKIANRYLELATRKTICINVKYANDGERNHLTNVNRKVLYKYRNCDYCGNEIIVNSRNDGIVTLPSTLTKKNKLKLALCDKCIKPVVAEFEEE